MTDAIILCGGAGLRLRPVTGSAPKSMAQVSGRPFLETLIRQLQRCGFERVVLAVGHGAEDIQSHFGQSFERVRVEYSKELAPLGTGGAIRNALDRVKTAACLVMNGDSYTDVALPDFVSAHREAKADVSVVVVPVDERADVGSIVVDSDNNVVKFAEKDKSPLARHLNAGIYMLSRQIIQEIPPGLPISIERELFPAWIREARRVRAFVHAGKCVDIGTPERYQAAQTVLAATEAGVNARLDKEYQA